MAIGMSREETLDLPYGELLDLIAVYQIKCEGLYRLPGRGEYCLFG